jgi:hypothetical protein
VAADNGGDTQDFTLASSSATTFNTTVSQNIYIFPQWSANNASNTITLDDLSVTGL